ncbi:MAG: ribosome-associated translation inhibitor RaiA [Myxococcota bacterium]|nr:ribosome-associated translation inhibitor RaiA [Myxococcota bacterium]
MDVAVTFRHMEPTDALKQYVDEKVSKIARHLVKESGAEVVLSVERHHHHADIRLKSGGVAMRGHETSTDMYNSIDRAVSKIERQLSRYQGKLRRFNQPKPVATVLLHTLEREEESTEAPEPATKLVRSRSFDAHPLSVDEAMMQIDLLNNAFLVFVNADSGSINVLYRLENDDGFGLIDTGNST